MKDHFVAKIVAGVLVFLLIAGAGFGVHYYQLSLIPATPVQEVKASGLDTEAVQEVFNEAGELVTKKVEYEGYYEMEDEKNWGDFHVPFTRSTATLWYEGVIAASYDLSDVIIEVNQDTKSVFVTLPIMQLQNTLNNYEVENENYGFFTEFDQIDIEEAAAKVKNMEYETAANAGLAEEAEENAKKSIGGLLSQIDGVEDYEIVFNCR